MSRVNREIEMALSAGRGALHVTDLPDLRRSLQRRVADGHLLQIWPRVLIAPHQANNPVVLARALLCWQPDAVLTGLLAAHLTFWPTVPVHEVTASVPVQIRAVPPHYRLISERLPPEVVHEVDGLRVTVPAFTAVDLAAHDSGAAIDEALRRGACQLADLHTALDLTPRRAGNRLRRTVVRESRDEPWSQAERKLHVLLRRARVTGWVTNHGVRCGAVWYYLDVAFVAQRVAIEVDGYEVHSRFDQFHRDRRRWTELQADGWLILHVSWEQLTADPNWVLDHLARLLALARSDAPRRSRRH